MFNPSCLTLYAAFIEYSLIISCSSCLSPPLFTASISIVSVAIKGSSSFICLFIIFSYTTKPSVTFIPISSIASAAIKAWGIANLLLAESSKLLSNHWVAWTKAGLNDSVIIYLDNDAILSLLIGFLL